LARSPGVLREGGRLVSVAEQPPQATGVTSVYFVVEPNLEQLTQIADLFNGGWPPPAIDSVFALEDAANAFERTMAADKRGKVVLEPWRRDQPRSE
jgi:NADPH:quinone reductase-like Zn-dependent oxidoreductase